MWQKERGGGGGLARLGAWMQRRRGRKRGVCSPASRLICGAINEIVRFPQNQFVMQDPDPKYQSLYYTDYIPPQEMTWKTFHR